MLSGNMTKNPRRLALAFCLIGYVTIGLRFDAAAGGLPPDFWKSAMNRIEKGDYLGPLVDLIDKDTQDRQIAQDLACLYSYVGLVREAMLAMPSDAGPARGTFDPGQFEPVDAVDSIVRAAKHHQAVFVNEAHHMPVHRTLTFRLLAPLYEQGYRYFAVETLANDAQAESQLNRQEYPSLEITGFYCNEPLYADLIREALKLGYTLVAYEWVPKRPPRADMPPPGIEVREQAQAENLDKRVFQRDPAAKLLVHLGYSHLDEGTADMHREKWKSLKAQPEAIEAWSKEWMARRFRRLTGKDPLTVDQVKFSERANETSEHPDYKKAMSHYDLGQPYMLRSKSKEDTFYLTELSRGHVDMQVFTPRTVFKDGRPAWLALGGARKPVLPPSGICRNTFPCLIQAVSPLEKNQPVPIDQIAVMQAGPIPCLYLPTGSFWVLARDVHGRVLHETRIVVDRSR